MLIRSSSQRFFFYLKISSFVNGTTSAILVNLVNYALSPGLASIMIHKDLFKNDAVTGLLVLQTPPVPRTVIILIAPYPLNHHHLASVTSYSRRKKFPKISPKIINGHHLANALRDPAPSWWRHLWITPIMHMFLYQISCQCSMYQKINVGFYRNKWCRACSV